MKTDEQRDKLNKNYDELEDAQKDNLLVIGEKLLGIQDVINREKAAAVLKSRKAQKQKKERE